MTNKTQLLELAKRVEADQSLSPSALWQRYQMLFHTKRSYGKAVPLAILRYPLPPEGSAHEDFLFAATATQEEYDAALAAAREDMRQWKARVAPLPKHNFRNIKVNI